MIKCQQYYLIKFVFIHLIYIQKLKCGTGSQAKDYIWVWGASDWKEEPDGVRFC